MIQLLWKIVWWPLQKIKKELLYYPAILLLDMYPKELKARTWTDISSLFIAVLFTAVFIAVLFTTAKKYKQFMCPSKEKRMSKMRDIHIVEYYYAFKKNKILKHASTWINLENLMPNKWNKPDIKGQILYDSTYMRYLE